MMRDPEKPGLDEGAAFVMSLRVTQQQENLYEINFCTDNGFI